jgi:hypothetical protein
MKTTIFVLQVVGVMLFLVGMGQVLGVTLIFEILKKEGISYVVSFWQSWSILAIGALTLLFGYVAEVIYDAGCKSATKEDED